MRRGIFGLKIIVCVVLFALAAGFVVMNLWNWLIPVLFKGPPITFYQALGLLLLSKILFGGFKKWGGGCCGGGHMKNHWRGQWKKRWEEKMANMTPEEREKVKEKYKKWCNWDDDESKQGESKCC